MADQIGCLHVRRVTCGVMLRGSGGLSSPPFSPRETDARGQKSGLKRQKLLFVTSPFGRARDFDGVSSGFSKYLLFIVFHQLFDSA